MKIEGWRSNDVAEALRGPRAEHKIGLVIEGGGMRSAWNVASLEALESLGLRPAIAEAFATSAGALNAAYFLSGGIEQAINVYLSDLCDPRFISPYRWPDFMDLDHLFERCVLNGPNAFSLEALARAPQPLWVSMTDVETGLPHFARHHDLAPVELVSALKASCASPMMTSKRVSFRGRGYNDGDVHSAVSIAKAVEEGCTHAVVLLTKPHGFRRRPTRLMKGFERLRTWSFSAEFRRHFFHGPNHYNRALDSLYDGSAGIPCLVIAPEDGELRLESHTRDPKVIRRAHDWARGRALEALRTTLFESRSEDRNDLNPK